MSQRFSHPAVFRAVVALGLKDWLQARGGMVG